MSSERTPADGQSGRQYGGMDQACAAVVGTTRKAWIERPEELLRMDARIAVGIGFAALTRGGWLIFEEDSGAGVRPMSVAEAEDLARSAPEQEWCIHLIGPNGERHYKRVGAEQWKLYQWGAGLANPGRSYPRRRSASIAKR